MVERAARHVRLRASGIAQAASCCWRAIRSASSRCTIADDGWTFRFASQAKALLAGGAVSRDPDPAGIVGFHLLGSVPEPFTSSAASARCRPAHSVIVDAARPATRRTSTTASPQSLGRRAGNGTPAEAARRQVRAAVHDSRARIIWWPTCRSACSCRPASIPARCSAAMAELGRARNRWPSRCASTNSAGDRDDEAPLAAEVARALRRAPSSCARSTARRVRARPADDPRRDGPADHRRHQHLVRRQGRARGRHQGGAVAGSAATNCFGGYPSFDDVPRSVHLLRPFRFIPGLGGLVRRLMSSTIASARAAASEGGRRAAIWRRLGRRLSAAARRLHAVGARPRCSIRSWSRRACAGWRRSATSPTSCRPAARSATSTASRRSRPRSTCATSCCATPTGPAWLIRSRSACPYVDPFFLAAAAAG